MLNIIIYVDVHVIIKLIGRSRIAVFNLAHFQRFRDGSIVPQ